MGYFVLKADFELLSAKEGGRVQPIKSGYTPNHRFDKNSYYIGLITFDDELWHHPGEKNQVTIKMLDAPNCQERLNKGFTWEVTEGIQVIGRMTLVSVESYVDN